MQCIYSKLFFSRKKKYLKNLGCKIYEFKLPYSEVVKKCLKYSKEKKTYNRCTGINPITRDGKKIFSYELLSKFKKNFDYFILPVGDGNILSGCIKGFIRGSIEGFSNGFIKGFIEGFIEGFIKSFLEGFTEDFMEGFMEDFIDGLDVWI